MKPLGTMVAIALATIALAPATASAGQPPETTITAGPVGPTGDSTPSFGFISDQPGSSFACRLDGGTWTLSAGVTVAVPAHVFNPGWEPCTSPHSYSHVADGSHTFEVRASGAAGETDPSPAARVFAVDTSIAGELSAKSVQKQHRRRVRIKVSVIAAEQLAIRVRGAIALKRPRGNASRRFALAPRTAQLSAGRTKAIRLHLAERSDQRRIAKAVRNGHTADAALFFTLTNGLGNSIAQRLTVELKPEAR